MLLLGCSGLLGDCLLGPEVLGQGSILVVVVSCKQMAADLWSAGLWPLFVLEVQYWLQAGDHRVVVVAFDCWEVLLPVATPVVV